ncbi:MAG: hypothetical protein ACXWH0_16030 [Acidimicrobiia bacterium]
MSTIGIVFGGPSPEHDISILSGLQVARILGRAADEVLCLYWTKTGSWRRVPVDSEASAFLEPAVPQSSEVELRLPGGFVESRRLRSVPLELDVVVNCCHGGPGEDGSLTSLLRLAGLKVTGPRPEAAALAMDKYATAALAAHLGLPAIDTRLVGESSIDLPPPWVVKPRFGGSSLGVEVGVRDIETARALAASGLSRAGCIAQPYLDGWIDLNVAVRTHPGLEVSAVERPLRGDQPILDYRTKYLRGPEGMESSPRELPAAIPSELAKQISDMAVEIVTAMGLTGLPRVDFLWNGDAEVKLCEVNSIPGALGLYLWEAAGVPREAVLRDWVNEGLGDTVMRPQWSAMSDGAALRVASSISTKLAL